MKRRQYVLALGTTATVSLSGCAGGDNSDGEPTDTGDPDTDTDTGDPDTDTETGTSGPGTPSESMPDVDSGPVSGSTFRLSDLDPATTTVELDTEFDVSVTVENLTDTEQSGTVQMLSDGINYNRDVTLQPNGSQTVTFAAVPSSVPGEGTHTFSISIGDATVEGVITVTSSSDGG